MKDYIFTTFIQNVGRKEGLHCYYIYTERRKEGRTTLLLHVYRTSEGRKDYIVTTFIQKVESKKGYSVTTCIQNYIVTILNVGRKDYIIFIVTAQNVGREVLKLSKVHCARSSKQ